MKTKLKLCVLFVAAIGVGATCAQAKSDVKTALDAALDACRAQLPQGIVAIVDSKDGSIVAIACATAAEIEAAATPLLGARKMAAEPATCPPTDSVAIVVDDQGAPSRRLCLSRAEAETMAAAIADRRKATP